MFNVKRLFEGHHGSFGPNGLCNCTYCRNDLGLPVIMFSVLAFLFGAVALVVIF